MNLAHDINPCFICGSVTGDFDYTSGYKHARWKCNCGAVGPTVVTHYDVSNNAPWFAEAAFWWNVWNPI